MAEAVHRMTLAIPASLKPRLDEIAHAERRSLNKQIIVLLEKATVITSRPEGGAPAAGELSRA